MGACGCKKSSCELNDDQKAILGAIAKSEAPCAGKEVAAELGMEPKSVSCKITALKKKGFVESPVRCKYSITEEGKKML